MGQLFRHPHPFRDLSWIPWLQGIPSLVQLGNAQFTTVAHKLVRLRAEEHQSDLLRQDLGVLTSAEIRGITAARWRQAPSSSNDLKFQGLSIWSTLGSIH